MLKYDSKNAVTTWPEGEYQAVIAVVHETKSKSSGNDMYEIKFEVWNDDQKRVLTDYLVLAKPYKLRSLAIALGEYDAFKADEFDPGEFTGSVVTVRLVVEESDQYGAQNKIASYWPKKDDGLGSSSMPPKNTAADVDDELGF